MNHLNEIATVKQQLYHRQLHKSFIIVSRSTPSRDGVDNATVMLN
jgi:hypothetical protein